MLGMIHYGNDLELLDSSTYKIQDIVKIFHHKSYENYITDIGIGSSETTDFILGHC